MPPPPQPVRFESTFVQIPVRRAVEPLCPYRPPAPPVAKRVYVRPQESLPEAGSGRKVRAKTAFYGAVFLYCWGSRSSAVSGSTMGAAHAGGATYVRSARPSLARRISCASRSSTELVDLGHHRGRICDRTRTDTFPSVGSPLDRRQDSHASPTRQCNGCQIAFALVLHSGRLARPSSKSAEFFLEIS